jgi:glutathione synthase/RimK-type ligase-like ATP-grasp enzyme
MRTPAVLLLTHRADHYTVDRVAEAVARRGFRPVRFDTDRFPSHARVSIRYGSGEATLLPCPEASPVDSGDVRGVWLRHVWPAPRVEGLETHVAEAAARESAMTLRGAWDALRHAHWINRPEAVASAGDKPRQLRMAREAGLEIPRTLLTNDPDAARAFHAELAGRVVAKMLTSVSRGMDGSGPTVHTSRVRESDLAKLDGLRLAPMLFQEEIEKERELRVVVVRGELFAGSLDTSRSPVPDSRKLDPATVHWERAALPDDVARPLLALHVALGLEFGASDVIRTPEGRHVFLEVNPCGEWGMLERDLDLPISDALARGVCED